MSDKTQLITSLDFAYDAIQHECYNDALSSILEAKEAAHQILDMGDKAQLDRINEILLSISDSDDTLGFHERNRLAHKILDICQPRCEWKMSNDGFYDVWESTCGNSFVLNDGSPEDNEMNYCSHCGGKLIQPIPEDTA